jgi:glycosyltransferase involved in cell wall biosynthesis
MPVGSTWAGRISEIFQPGENGRQVEPRETDELAQEIFQILGQ